MQGESRLQTNLTFRVGDATGSPVQVLRLAAAGSSFRRGQVNVVACELRGDRKFRSCLIAP